MSTPDAWDPGQYERFAAERSQPFFDLMALVEPDGVRRAVDLGCGTGTLTAALHERLGAGTTTLGLDSSPAMLDQAAAHAGAGLSFGPADIGAPDLAATITAALGAGPSGDAGPELDLVLANAALHWVPGHETVLARWAALLGPGGQLAVQVPTNADHPSHRVIQELAAEEPYLSAGDGPPPPDPVWSVLRPEAYAEALFALGFERQHVRLQVYGHVLPSAEAVVEWTKGTSLTRIKRHFPTPIYEAFVEEYRRRLVAELGDRQPYFYAFKRILFWGRMPA